MGVAITSRLTFSARTVFRVPVWLHHLLAAGRILVKSSFEAYMQQHMSSKLEQFLQEHRLVALITQLRGERSTEKPGKTRKTTADLKSSAQTPSSVRTMGTGASRTGGPVPDGRLRRC